MKTLYSCYVEGSDSPQLIHMSLELAMIEAERLALTERKPVHVLKTTTIYMINWKLES